MTNYRSKRSPSSFGLI
uniref:Uncharacterized protein n=1 Tax=Anguilla anguilla TaxID=7936 RepID=A0A0E9PNP1_ANGAN